MEKTLPITLVLESQTITTYEYDEAHNISKETKDYFKPEETPTASEVSVLATDAVFVAVSEKAPEGYVVIHDKHYTAKGVWFSKLPEKAQPDGS